MKGTLQEHSVANAISASVSNLGFRKTLMYLLHPFMNITQPPNTKCFQQTMSHPINMPRVDLNVTEIKCHNERGS